MNWDMLDDDMFGKGFEEEEMFEIGEKIKENIVPIYENHFKENGFGIYTVELENERRYTAKGVFPGNLTIGSTYEIEAVVEKFRGETQLHVKNIRISRATSKKAIVHYLQTLKGLKSRAESIYDSFGNKTLETLMNEPELVAKQIKGVGVKMSMDWAEQLKAKLHEEELMLYLYGLGLNPAQVEMLTKIYGENLKSVLEDNPYRLIQDVRGYGFKRCDKIARSAGIAFDNPKRVRAGILHALEESTKEGHTFLPSSILQKNVNELLRENGKNILFTLVTEAMECLSSEEAIIIENEKVFLNIYRQWEEDIARRSIELAKKTDWARTSEKDIENSLNDFLRETKIHLEDKQREAVLRFSSKNGGFFILRGSAGCGKTFTLNVILSVLRDVFNMNRKPYKVKVMAPTGKASKVASKAIGLPCSTIHAGLEYSPEIDGFTFNEENPLEETVIVVDEGSMLDTELAKDLLLAIANGTKVIFMGDTKQLASVGAGNVLKDLINGGVVDVVTLNVVKRQGLESGIIKNATRIIEKEMIQSFPESGDAFFIPRDTDEETLKTLIQSIKRLKQKGFTDSDIQVLVPQRKGLLGTYNLNRALQQELNPDGEQSDIKNQQYPREEEPIFFRKGDKVIHIQNKRDMSLYHKHGGKLVEMEEQGISNGECGVIDSIGKVAKWSEKEQKTIMVTRITVKYEDWYVCYESMDDFMMLDHAYALTIHKSQGSQWEAVIMPISMGHSYMLDNNLLYTGKTRARKIDITIGSHKALLIGIKKERSSVRYTGLCELMAS